MWDQIETEHVHLETEKVKRLCDCARGREPVLTKVEVEPTDRCNLDCLFCWRQRDVDYDFDCELSEEKLLSMIRQSADLGALEWRIGGGGEPMVRYATTIKMMAEIKRLGMMGALTTNGTIFSDDDVKSLIEIGWDYVEFSIDGPDAATNDFLRGRKGAFDRSVKSLERFARWKKHYGREKPALFLNTVVVNRNYDKLGRMLKMAKKYGMREFSINPMTVFSPEVSFLKLDEAESERFQSMLPSFIEMARDFGIRNSLQDFLDVRIIRQTSDMKDLIQTYAGGDEDESAGEIGETEGEQAAAGDIPEFPSVKRMQDFLRLPCYDPWYLITIRGGKIAPCSGFLGTGLDPEGLSVEEIWFGERQAAIRRDLETGELPDYCKDCSSNMVARQKRLRGKMDHMLLTGEYRMN
ncbi:radical SAM/SPASM domain-containing protein [Thermodesulfobacteriota bacterium]